MTVKKENRYTISKDVVSKMDGNGVVHIMLLGHDEFFLRIDKLAAESWKQIEQGHSFNDILNSLTARYPTKEKEISRDLIGLFENLIQHKIIS